ncbi:MAG: ADOP family duplicated permease [Gemmatimonadaceae bacterium]
MTRPKLSPLARIRAAFAHVTGWFRRGDREARLAEEIRFHMDMAAEKNRRLGMSSGEAARVAAVSFGGREHWREASRDEYRSRPLDDLAQDLRYAVRTLRSAPAFTVAAVLTLAIGIGGNTAIFSAVDGVMLKPLPFSGEDRLVRLYETDRAKGRERHDVSPGNFAEWRARATAFAEMAVAEPYGFRLSGKDGAEEIRNWNVTQDFFTILDAKPELGRLFQPSDFVPGPPQAIVLTYASWQKRFGADRNVIGRHLTIAGAQTTIVGVLPRDFSYLETRTPQEFYAPKVLDSIEVLLRGNGWYNAVGRLEPGVSVAQANADLNRVATQLGREFPKSNGNLGAAVIPLRDGIVGDSSRALVLSLAAAGLVLLIACSNVANLMLARTNRRGREFAVRAALGAGRWRIVRQVLSESFVVAVLGGAAGVALAYWGVGLIRSASPESIPRVDEMRVDGRAFLFALATVLSTTVLFGLVPAFRAADPSAGEELKAGGRSVGTSRQRRMRSALVMSEVALAIMLLVSAGLLLRSFASLRSVDRGYRSDHVLGALMFTWEVAQTPAAQRTVVERLVERARSLPGVRSAGATSSPPLAGTVGVERGPITILGRPVPPGQEPQAHVTSLTPGAFDALGMALVRGRTFTPQDDSGSVMVAVINESMARRFWPGENPIGRHVKIGFYTAQIDREVVGIVADTKQSALDAPAEATVYLPNAQAPTGSIWLVMHTAIEPNALARDVKRIVAEVDPSIPIAGIQAFDDMLSYSLRPRRFTLSLFVSFAVAALLLAMVGVYGVLSHGTAERAREFGVRVALGAQPWDIVAMVMRQGLGAACLGIVIGLAISAAATRVLSSMLFTVTPFDAVTFVGVSALMLVTAMLACYVPARRATRVDPLVALREG